MEDFLALKFKSIWAHFRKDHLSFWMICGYLFIEYVRPQSIIPALDVLPWAQLFIFFAFVACLLDRSITWVSDSTNKWMIIFLSLIILSTLNATYPDIARERIKDFFQWFIIYFLIINIVNSDKRLFILLLLFLFASFKMSLFLATVWAFRGFSFTDWGLMGPPGYFHNSGELAIQMLMFSPIAYRLMIGIKPRLAKFKYWMMLAMPITGAMTVMGASSRGGQLGMAFQIYHTFLKGRLSIKSILLAFVIITAGYWALPDEQRERFAATGEDKTSQQRLLYWKHGIEMIQDHPWQGVGYFNFPQYYEDYYWRDKLYDGHAQLPHNIFIQIGTDTGIPGLVVYLFLIYSGFKKTSEVRKLVTKLPSDSFNANLTRGFDAALIGYLIAGQFVTVAYYPFMWIHLAFVVSLKNIILKQAMLPSNGPSPVRTSKSYLASY